LAAPLSPCLDTVGQPCYLPSRAAISFCDRRIQAWSVDNGTMAAVSSIIVTWVRDLIPAVSQPSVCDALAGLGPRSHCRRSLATDGVPGQDENRPVNEVLPS